MGILNTSNEILLGLRRLDNEDATILRAFFDRLPSEDRRMRFLHPLPRVSDEFVRQMCTLNPRTEAAWVLSDRARIGVHALTSVHLLPNGTVAEFALVVEEGFKRNGIGTQMLRLVSEFARMRGAQVLHGEVLVDNVPMLALAKRFGFRRQLIPNSNGVMQLQLELADVLSRAPPYANRQLAPYDFSAVARTLVIPAKAEIQLDLDSQNKKQNGFRLSPE